MSVNTPARDKQLQHNDTELPSDCLSSISMPKNWNQVEELKNMKYRLQQKIATVSKHYEKERCSEEDDKRNVEEANNLYQAATDHPNGQAFEPAARGNLHVAHENSEKTKPQHKHHKHKKHKHKRSKDRDKNNNHAYCQVMCKDGDSKPSVEARECNKQTSSNLSKATDFQNFSLKVNKPSKRSALPITSSTKPYIMSDKMKSEDQDDTMEMLTAEKINRALLHAKTSAIKVNENKHPTVHKMSDMVVNIDEKPLQTINKLNPKVVIETLDSPGRTLVSSKNSEFPVCQDGKHNKTASSDRNQKSKYLGKSENSLEKEKEKQSKSYTNQGSKSLIHKKEDSISRTTMGVPLNEISESQYMAASSKKNNQSNSVTCSSDLNNSRPVIIDNKKGFTKKVKWLRGTEISKNEKSIKHSEVDHAYKKLAQLKMLKKYNSKKMLINKQKLILNKWEIEMNKQGLDKDRYTLKAKLALAMKKGESELQDIKKSLLASKPLKSVFVSSLTSRAKPSAGSLYSNSNVNSTVQSKDITNSDKMETKAETVEQHPKRVILENESVREVTKVSNKTLSQEEKSQNYTTRAFRINRFPFIKSMDLPNPSVSDHIFKSGTNRLQTDDFSAQDINVKGVPASGFVCSPSCSTLLPETDSSSLQSNIQAGSQTRASYLQTFPVARPKIMAMTQPIFIPSAFSRIPVVPRGIDMASHSSGLNYTRASSNLSTYLSSAGNINASQMIGNSVNKNQLFSALTLPGLLFGSSNVSSNGLRPVLQNVNGSLCTVLNIIGPPKGVAVSHSSTAFPKPVQLNTSDSHQFMNQHFPPVGHPVNPGKSNAFEKESVCLTSGNVEFKSYTEKDKEYPLDKKANLVGGNTDFNLSSSTNSVASERTVMFLPTKKAAITHDTAVNPSSLGCLSSNVRNAQAITKSYQDSNKSTSCISVLNQSENRTQTISAVLKDKKYRFHSGKPKDEQTIFSAGQISGSSCTTETPAVRNIDLHTLLAQTVTAKQQIQTSAPVTLYRMEKDAGLVCSQADIQQMTAENSMSMLQNESQASDKVTVDDESKLELFEQFKIKPLTVGDNNTYQAYENETTDPLKETVKSIPRIKNYYSLSENTFDKFSGSQTDNNRSVLDSEAGINKKSIENLSPNHRVVNITLQTDKLKDQTHHMSLPVTSISNSRDTQILTENDLLAYLHSTSNEKTKLILLNGNVCDKWERLKQNIGAETMSDPEFLHYLLNAVEKAFHGIQSESDVHSEAGQESDQLSSNLAGAERRMEPKSQPSSIATKDTSTPSSPDVITVDSDDSDHIEIIDIDSGSFSSTHVAEKEIDENNNSVTSPNLENKITETLRTSRKRPAPESPEDLSEHETVVKRMAGPEPRPVVAALGHSKIVGAMSTAQPLTEFEGLEPEQPGINESSKLISQELHEGDKPPAVSIPITTNMASPQVLLGKFFKEKMYNIPCRKDMLWYIDFFRDWLRDTNEGEDFEHKSAEWINSHLYKFYIYVAKQYSKSLYCFIFLGKFKDHMFTYLRWLSSNRVNLNENAEFMSSNQVYSVVSKVDSGFVPRYKKTIVFSEEDEVKLKNSRVLSDITSENLLWKVFFDITYYLGEETFPKNFLHNLTKDSLVFSSDERGSFYTFRDDRWPPHWFRKHKMYEKLSCSQDCPVRTMKLYLGKLSRNTAMFQLPRITYFKSSGEWYRDVPISNNKLKCLMSEISKAAQLSKIYSDASVVLLAQKYKFLDMLEQLKAVV